MLELLAFSSIPSRLLNLLADHGYQRSGSGQNRRNEIKKRGKERTSGREQSLLLLRGNIRLVPNLNPSLEHSTTLKVEQTFWHFQNPSIGAHTFKCIFRDL